MTALAAHPQTLVSAEAPPAVAVRGLGLRLDDRTILHDINLSFAPGQYVALLGANGAGKSTLLKVLATLLAPTAGTVEIFGQALTRNALSLRARIGLIGHQSMLYRDLSCAENLLFFARLYGIERPRNRVNLLLEAVGMAHRADDPVKNLSRGMTQRIAIARALLHSPDLILADEPFAGLDVPSSLALEEMLGILRGKGKTIVLVNHDIGQSLRLAERVVVLRQGQVVVDRATAGVSERAIVAEVGGT